MNPLQHLLIGLIRLYQLVLSPYMGNQCRFTPTCSHFAREAVEKHGAIKGSWLAVRGFSGAIPGIQVGTIRYLERVLPSGLLPPA